MAPVNAPSSLPRRLRALLHLELLDHALRLVGTLIIVVIVVLLCFVIATGAASSAGRRACS